MIFWRNIRSAPRDGRAILVSDGLPFVVRWKGSAFMTPHGAAVHYATHWKSIRMPIWPRIKAAYWDWRFSRLTA